MRGQQPMSHRRSLGSQGRACPRSCGCSEAELLRECEDEAVTERRVSPGGPGGPPCGRCRRDSTSGVFHTFAPVRKIHLRAQFSCCSRFLRVRGAGGVTRQQGVVSASRNGRKRLSKRGGGGGEKGQMRQTGEAEEATLMLLSSHRPSVSRCSSERLAPPTHSPHLPPTQDQHGVTAQSLKPASLTHTCQNSRSGQR